MSFKIINANPFASFFAITRAESQKITVKSSMRHLHYLVNSMIHRRKQKAQVGLGKCLEFYE